MSAKALLEDLLDACEDNGEACFPYPIRKDQPIVGYDKVNGKALTLMVETLGKRSRFPAPDDAPVLEEVHLAGHMGVVLVLAPHLDRAWALPWYGWQDESHWLLPEDELLTHFIRRKIYPKPERAPAPLARVIPPPPVVEIVENEADHVKVRHGHLAYEIRDGQVFAGVAGGVGEVMVHVGKGQIPAQVYTAIREAGRELGARLGGRR
jgi:hypothetical protein